MGSHCHVHGALGLPLGLVVLLDALDHSLGHAHQTLQLEGGALEAGEFPKLCDCLVVGSVVLQEPTGNEAVNIRAFVDTIVFETFLPGQ